MSFYHWFRSSKYAGYLGETDADERRILWNDPLMGDPLPPLESWVPPRLKQYLGGGSKKKALPIGDAPMSGLVNLISERAADALQDIWNRHALLYPVVLLDDPDAKYFMVVVRTELDCLDEERSVGKKHIVGPRVGTLATVDKWIFKDGCIGDNDLFVLPYSATATYVSERFKSLVIEYGLRGFCLKSELWEEKPFIS